MYENGVIGAAVNINRNRCICFCAEIGPLGKGMTQRIEQAGEPEGKAVLPVCPRHQNSAPKPSVPAAFLRIKDAFLKVLDVNRCHRVIFAGNL